MFALLHVSIHNILITNHSLPINGYTNQVMKLLMLVSQEHSVSLSQDIIQKNKKVQIYTCITRMRIFNEGEVKKKARLIRSNTFYLLYTVFKEFMNMNLEIL